MSTPKPDLLRGTLDLLVLEVLRTGPLHGYAIGRRIQQLSDDLLRVEQGSLYPALYRMHRRGWLRSRWGKADTGRRARIYSLTREGQERLTTESAAWREYAEGVQRVLEQLPEPGDR